MGMPLNVLNCWAAWDSGWPMAPRGALCARVRPENRAGGIKASKICNGFLMRAVLIAAFAVTIAAATPLHAATAPKVKLQAFEEAL
jgi:hypothetical protein